jgi:predicted acylesterase/phospholipase RssA
MAWKSVRPGPAAALVAALAAVLIGCAGPAGDGLVGFGFRRMERSEEELRQAVGWTDPYAQDIARRAGLPPDFVEFCDLVRALRRPPVPYPRRTVLVVSGGGVFGAHPAGVLCGWTEAGTRPEFDVVTGVSTGALLAVFAFLGPSVDPELRTAYTTVENRDVYRRRRFPQLLLSESLADNSPLARQIASYATDERIRQVAAEHRRGRRLYVGTTDLDVRRGVYWDLGAIACRDTPEDRDLFRKALLASAAIPGFFPPVRIPVSVDGKRYVERHVDGGTTSSMFFAPPYVPPEAQATLPPNWLAGSDLYILVAGKLYPDPSPVRSRSLAIAGSAISTILYDQTRSDLHKLFLLSLVTGMNYHMSVIPKDLPAPISATSFDPEEMTRLFEAGAAWARGNPAWRNTPPGAEPGEGGRFRVGPILTDGGGRAPVTPPAFGAPLVPFVPFDLPGGRPIPPAIPGK